MGRKTIAFKYNKLWHLLLDKGMTKEDLRQAIGASSSTIAKMSKNENVSLDIIDKICDILNCNMEDIIERVANTKDDE